ncbi:hypothetical protein SDC9_69390 [bioreactor metagenome]|uniref:Uncharacterized protein n=1 Tax=bioreactor metagenome TaxID=1076179 RepID=A0A644Y312_9ZZZZ
MEHIDHKAFCHGVHRVGLPRRENQDTSFVEENLLSPDGDLHLSGYHVHHLFVGVVMKGENRSRIHVPVSHRHVLRVDEPGPEAGKNVFLFQPVHVDEFQGKSLPCLIVGIYYIIREEIQVPENLFSPRPGKEQENHGVEFKSSHKHEERENPFPCRRDVVKILGGTDRSEPGTRVPDGCRSAAHGRDEIHAQGSHEQGSSQEDQQVDDKKGGHRGYRVLPHGFSPDFYPEHPPGVERHDKT